MLIIDKIKARIARSKFAAKWENRNVDHAYPFLKGLQIPYTVFHSDIFVQHSNELVERLNSIDFRLLYNSEANDIKDDLRKFGFMVFYNEEYNICLRLCKKETLSSIKLALQILTVANGNLTQEVQRVVFTSTLKVVMDEKTITG